MTTFSSPSPSPSFTDWVVSVWVSFKKDRVQWWHGEGTVW